MKAATMQYTIRNIPKPLDQRLRKLAHKGGKSLNQVVLEMLSNALGLNNRTNKQESHHDLDFLIGTWRTDPKTEKALAEQNLVESDQWE